MVPLLSFPAVSKTESSHCGGESGSSAIAIVPERIRATSFETRDAPHEHRLQRWLILSSEPRLRLCRPFDVGLIPRATRLPRVRALALSDAI